MTTKSRNYRLAPSDAALVPSRSESNAAAPGLRQVSIRIHATSLNCRDLLTLQDTASNRAGLIPLSDGAGSVVAVGSKLCNFSNADDDDVALDGVAPGGF